MAMDKSPFRLSMDKGNAYYDEGKTIRPVCLRPLRLKEALQHFHGALSIAQSPSDRASALKNLAVASQRIVLEDETEDTERYCFFSECIGHAIDAIDLAVSGATNKSVEWVHAMFELVRTVCKTALVNTVIHCPKTQAIAQGRLEQVVYSPTSSAVSRCLISQILIAYTHRRSVAANDRKEWSFAQTLLGKYSALTQELDRVVHDIPKGSTVFVDVMAGFRDEIEQLMKDLAITRAEIESQIALRDGRRDLDDALHKHAALPMDLVMQAMDNFSLAATVAAGHVMSIEAEARSLIGHVYAKVLKLEPSAKRHYEESVRLSASCYPQKFTHLAWYAEALRFVSEQQQQRQKEDEAARQRERQPYLDELKPELDVLGKKSKGSPMNFLEHLYTTYKPGGKATLDKEACATNFHHVLVHTILHFHPDRNTNAPRKQQILYEEITKNLNEYLESSKGL